MIVIDTSFCLTPYFMLIGLAAVQRFVIVLAREISFSYIFYSEINLKRDHLSWV